MMNWKSVLILLAFCAYVSAFCVGGCSAKGDIDMPTGQYDTIVVDPHGITYSGSTIINLIGTSMTFFLSSPTLNVTARGTLGSDNTFLASADILDSTTTGSSGGQTYAVVNLTFTTSRSSFNGEVIVDEGNYILQGTKI